MIGNKLSCLANNNIMTEQDANNYLKEKYPNSNWQDGIVRDINNWNRFVGEISNGSYDGTIRVLEH